MAYFQSEKIKTIPLPIPDVPPYVPPTPPTPPTPGQGSDNPVPRPSFDDGIHVTFYKTFDDNNVVNKTLNIIYSDAIAFNENFDIMKPSILISSNVDLSNCNICYITELHRYYFMDAPVLEVGGYYRIQLHIDALMTYKNGIRTLNGIIKKTEDETLYNADYNDGSFVNQEGLTVEIVHFPLGFDETPINVLITAGGEGNE